ncbi:hypothetical protein SASPL_132600 [Salvia splendens]|uniref:Uncharacterized protein n=1 Tax=Salvia splendens TaxID=180675 RepID=A0A8X8X3B3_SALSN|nr:hypothetical protein SASPL_132600 [Salvia splendens]
MQSPFFKDRVDMSSARRAGQAAGASAGDEIKSRYIELSRRLAKGKVVADGESSGKRKSVVGKNAVRQLGFGGLLNFDVTSVPGTLAYWLLEHFDHLRCSLMLPNDVELEVDTKDVELVFGFPNGGIKTH